MHEVLSFGVFITPQKENYFITSNIKHNKVAVPVCPVLP